MPHVIDDSGQNSSAVILFSDLCDVIREGEGRSNESIQKQSKSAHVRYFLIVLPVIVL